MPVLARDPPDFPEVEPLASEVEPAAEPAGSPLLPVKPLVEPLVAPLEAPEPVLVAVPALPAVRRVAADEVLCGGGELFGPQTLMAHS
jgi:hypothetical protein